MNLGIGFVTLREKHFANCSTRAACERQGLATWGLNKSTFRCSAPRVAAHVQAIKLRTSPSKDA